MRVFGLTGGIASGKSLVAARFAGAGVPVIDADALAREVVAPGSAALEEIRQHFGPQALAPDGTLARAWLAERVFSDPQELAALERITHPRVAARFAERIGELARQGHPLACYEVPLLFERQLEPGLRPVVVVHTRPELQVARAMTRNGWSAEQVRARMRAQLPLEEKCARADYLIDNNGSLAETHAATDRVLRQLRSLPATH